MNLEASKVAEGISEALVLTFEGVFLSVPAIFFYALFRNRISKLVVGNNDVGRRYVARCGSCCKAVGLTMHFFVRSSRTNMTPILDMVFQLITFFMLVVNFKAADVNVSGSAVIGSAAPSDEPDKREMLVLNILQDGTINCAGNEPAEYGSVPQH